MYSATGGSNTAVGADTLYHSTGSNNLALGINAGYNLTTGYNNIEIGNEGVSTDDGVIRIGAQIGVPSQTATFIAGINGVNVGSGTLVFINSNGQLGTINSSIRYKEDVHDMADRSAGLMQLRPVIFRYKQPGPDGTKPIEYGLIAEEVAEVYPDLIVRNHDGEIQTVQYQKLTPMLLNEVQKQQRQIESDRQLIHDLERRLADLESLLGQKAAAPLER